jgi:5-methylcytosine-specific restriction endonuclease McrBC regulatory subunit McrC
MLRISEHFHYYSTVEEQTQRIQNILEAEQRTVLEGDWLFFKNDPERLCVSVLPDNDRYRIESSYYIGLGWLSKWKKPVYIQPKVNSETNRLNYLVMLSEALKEPENFNHLEDLMDIRFDEPWIAVAGGHQIHLTPFLIAQFLLIVRNIVRKGLKKDYYRVTENLQGKVKGKILVAQQIRQNVVRNKLTNTVCSYQEYGIDTATNRFLKYVLQFVSAHIANLQEPELKNTLQEQLVFNRAAFQLVKEQQFYSFEQKELNPLYKEYNIAIHLGNQLLRLLDHNLTKATETLTQYPPHWIDMSKLFELYVFKRLRETFPGSNEVRYHVKTNRQELDFVIHSGNFKAVVDAKYKPRYASGNPSMDDARQLAGYARLNSVYRELGVEENQLIPVYVVYPSALKDSVTSNNDNQEEDFELITETSLTARNAILSGPVRKSKAYCSMFMQEVDLPVQHVVST